MRNHWKRLSYYTHTQVFLRVIPVVFVTVLAVGAFSWVVFFSNLVERASAHHRQELTAFAGNLRHRASLEAMTIESWKEKSWNRFDAGAGWTPQQLAGARNLWVEQITGFPLVGAAVLASNPNPDGEPVVRTAFCDSLDNAANRQIVARWVANHAELLGADLDLREWGRVHRPEELIAVDADLFHATYLLSPMLLQVSGTDLARVGGASRRALLPVLVRERSVEAAAKSRSPSFESATHGVYFMDLQALVREVPLEDWWCVLGADDLVMGSQSNVPLAGIRLRDQPELQSVGIFDAISGADLSRWVDSNWIGTDSRLVGWRGTPWMVTATRPGDLPMSLLLARPADSVKSITLRYAAAILAVALAALLGSFIGISKVLEPFSRRINSVSEHMERLAEGDYSIRMEPREASEVERLVGYFNTMAGSLDETNRELGEKTRRLAAALRDMQELDRAKDDFLVLISHEVRTPLTSIMGGIDYLKASLSRCEDSLREALLSLNVGEITEIMDHSAGRLRDFMNDAIQMISIQNSDRQLRLQSVPAVDLLRGTLTALQGRIAQRGLDVSVELSGEEGWELLCDIEVLQVALGRILDNAVTHNVDGGRIRIAEVREVPGQGAVGELAVDEARLRLLNHVERAERSAETIQWRLLEIYNTGTPIPPDRRQALFSKFQIIGEIQHHQKGSGLSLPIALAAVEHHGGAIFLESPDGEGNSFYLLLPTVPAGSGQEQGDGVGGAAGDEQGGQGGHSAGLEVELDDRGAGAAGGRDQSGGGVDGACGADHEEELALPR